MCSILMRRAAAAAASVATAAAAYHATASLRAELSPAPRALARRFTSKPPQPKQEGLQRKPLAESFRLNRRVALVTGASRGLGLAMAIGLADQGAHVVLGGRDAETLAVARAALLLQSPAAACSTVAFDAADEASCCAAVAEVARVAGHTPDILVNNAGINHRLPLDDFTLDKFNAVLAANLAGPFVLSRECARGMKARGWGRILNVGSIMSHVGREGLHAYASSKHAIAGLTRSLAAELGGDGVCVNCICPGYFPTDLTQRLQSDAAFSGAVRRRTPAGRWGRPDELAGPAVFLCSDAASYVNGTTLLVDGGMTSTFHERGGEADACMVGA